MDRDKEDLAEEATSRVAGTITRDEDFKFDMDGMLSAKTKTAIRIGMGIFMAISFLLVVYVDGC